MTCLLCGNKLAIFRRMSIGDFCSQEHRALFLREQSDQGLARLVESKRDPQSSKSSTRVYAQFLPDEVAASRNGAHSVGYGPLAQAQMIRPEAIWKFVSRNDHYAGDFSCPADVMILASSPTRGPS